MKRFIGIDPHQASCTIAVVTESGRVVQTTVVETHGEALVSAVSAVAGETHLVIEEGLYSGWLYEILSPLVHRCVVGMPTGRVKQKSDEADALAMANALRMNDVQVVYKAPTQYRKLRDLSRVYRTAMQDATRSKNRLKAMYRARGVKVSGRALYRVSEREAWIEKLPAASQEAARLAHGLVDAIDAAKKAAEKALVREGSKHAAWKLLRTVPGIGPVWAAIILPVVVTPYRFRTVRQFWSYCGLGIVTRSSSDYVQTANGKWVRSNTQQTRGLNRRRNAVLKQVMKSAATTAIGKRGDATLREKYDQLCRDGTKPNLAKVTIARKIAALVLRILKDGQPYQAREAA